MRLLNWQQKDIRHGFPFGLSTDGRSIAEEPEVLSYSTDVETEQEYSKWLERFESGELTNSSLP